MSASYQAFKEAKGVLSDLIVDVEVALEDVVDNHQVPQLHTHFQERLQLALAHLASYCSNDVMVLRYREWTDEYLHTFYKENCNLNVQSVQRTATGMGQHVKFASSLHK